MIFFGLVNLFLEVFSSSDNHSLKCYSDSVCHRSDVVSLFYTCTHFHDVIVKSLEPVLTHTSFGFCVEMPCQEQTACREISMSDQVTKKADSLVKDCLN